MITYIMPFTISLHLNVQQIIAIAAQKKSFAVNGRTEKMRERENEKERKKKT